MFCFPKSHKLLTDHSRRQRREKLDENTHWSQRFCLGFPWRGFARTVFVTIKQIDYLVNWEKRNKSIKIKRKLCDVVCFIKLTVTVTGNRVVSASPTPVLIGKRGRECVTPPEQDTNPSQVSPQRKLVQYSFIQLS